MFDTCLILKLIGYFVKCGELKKENTTTFKSKKDKLKLISGTLKLLNIKNSMSINNRGLSLNSYDKTLYDFLLQFGFGRDRHIPRKFLNLDKFYLNYLLNAMSEISCRKTRDTSKIVTTASPKIINNIHEIAIKLNMVFNTTALYRDPMVKKQFNPLDYEGTPYFNTTITNVYGPSKLTKSKTNTTVYNLSLAPKPKFILIRNNSKPLWVSIP